MDFHFALQNLDMRISIGKELEELWEKLDPGYTPRKGRFLKVGPTRKNNIDLLVLYNRLPIWFEGHDQTEATQTQIETAGATDERNAGHFAYVENCKSLLSLSSEINWFFKKKFGQ